MPRHPPEPECSQEVTESARLVERARIILGSLAGKALQEVARELNISIPTVSKWRERFALFGVRGLLDRLRPGKPPVYGREFRNRVLALLEQPPPEGRSRWDCPAIAQKPGSSVHAV